MDILQEWITVYCAGCKMPKNFRKDASKFFNTVYNDCKDNSEYSDITKVNSVIYRVQSLNKYSNNPIILFDDLYYSFSNDIAGIQRVIELDSYLKSDIIIIESKPQAAINLNALLQQVYENPKSMYTSENEIVSKMSLKNIINIYYLRNSADIAEYKIKGVKINSKDVNLPSIKTKI